MDNSNVIRALLCEKAELLRKWAHSTDATERESLTASMEGIDQQVDSLRGTLRRRSMVVVREIRSVG